MTIKYAALVAWREYAENARTKGFWYGFFLLQVILFLSVRVPMLLETKATPVRYFILVDQSSNLASVVETRLDRLYQRQVLDALNEYARKNSATAQGTAFLLSQFL